MLTVADVAQTLQSVLGREAEDAARASGFVQRRSKLTGAAFVQALVFGWLADPEASREALAQTAAMGGVRVSAQAIDQRLSFTAATCLRQVLAAAATALLTADAVAIPLLARFRGVVVQDSTSIGLPGALAAMWPGCGNASTPAAASATLKLQVRLDLQRGGLTGPALQAGRTHDHPAVAGWDALVPDTLWLGDLGYFDLATFAAWHAAGVFWLVRLKAGTVVTDREGARLDLAALLPMTEDTLLDQPIQLGARRTIAARLLAVRVPTVVAAERRRRLHAEARRKGQPVSQARLRLADWTILVTNVPASRLTPTEALVLARARWQIELLFKLWKHKNRLTAWRSAKPAPLLCELYAKLLAYLVQHWVLLLACWDAPDRSLTKAAQTVRKFTAGLAAGRRHPARLRDTLHLIVQTLAAGCRLNTRRRAPSTCQRLLAGGPAP